MLSNLENMKYRSSEPKTEPEVREYIDNIFMNKKRKRWRNQTSNAFLYK